jgi:integrase
MVKTRKTDRHLPRRVYRKHGAYYFVDAANKWHRLGTTEPEMLRALATIQEASATGTLGGLIDRYEREVLPTKAAKTAKSQRLELARLAAVFGHMRPAELQPADCWAYFTQRGSGSAAHHEVRLLSHVFTWAMRWGCATVNPARGLGLKTPKPRTRYVTDEEFLTVRQLAPTMVGYAMDLALLTGLRQGDILALERRQLSDAGLAVQTSKTGKGLLFEWSDELRGTIAAALREAPQVRRFVICRHDGRAMTSSGFQSAWQRLMSAARAAGVERFTFHDLRAKSLSDSGSLQEASTRAGHADPRVTARVYRRLPERVKPLRILDSV